MIIEPNEQLIGDTDRDMSIDDRVQFQNKKRIVEALLFASAQPLAEIDFLFHLGNNAPLGELLSELAAEYAFRGVNLVRTADKWAFRTAEDLGHLLVRERDEPRRLSRAALETLAIIAYHQPVTRAEIEDIRGVATSKGTLDVLLESKWIKLRGRRRSPGRPVTYGTSESFLDQFGLQSLSELPGLSELKGAGFFDGRLPADFDMPEPSDNPDLRADEDPLDEDLFVLIAEERSNSEESSLDPESV
jgi:segregation and condensation protein B